MVNVVNDIEKHHPDYQGRIVPNMVDTDVKNRPFLGPRQFISSIRSSSPPEHARFTFATRRLCASRAAPRAGQLARLAKGTRADPQPPAHHLAG